jgi:hypothetical protein
MKFLALLAILPSIAFASDAAGSQQIPLGSSSLGDQKPIVPSTYWYETTGNTDASTAIQNAIDGK